MRHGALAIIAFLPIFAEGPSANAQGAQPDLAGAISRAKTQAQDIARFYGWAGQVPVVEGETLDTTASRISLSSAEMTELLTGVASYHLDEAARMIVAHEIWHFVELQDPGNRQAPRTQAERRSAECRADLMAGRFVTYAARYPEQSNVRFSNTQRVAESLWRTRSGDYPTLKQRHAAAHLGALSWFRERSGTALALGDTIELAGDFRAQEDPAEWRRRICDRVTHYRQEVVAALGAESPIVTTQGADTKFEIAYVNVSQRSLRVSLLLRARYFNVGDDRARQQHDGWTIPVDFEIAPGRKHRVRGVLPGFVGETDKVVFDYSPEREETEISAEYIAGVPLPAEVALAPGLSPEDTRFALAVHRLANDTTTGFSRSRAAGGSFTGDSLWIPAVIEIPGPGTSDTAIWLRNDGSSSVGDTFYSGESAEEAQRIFDEMRDRIVRIWPTAKLRPVDGYPQGVSFQVTRFARVRLWISSYQQSHSTRFEITPNALGILDE